MEASSDSRMIIDVESLPSFLSESAPGVERCVSFSEFSRPVRHPLAASWRGNAPLANHRRIGENQPANDDNSASGRARGAAVAIPAEETGSSFRHSFPTKRGDLMRALLGVVLASALLFVATGSARAADSDAKSIVDKAIAAAGGAEKLGKVAAFSMKAKGVVVFGGNENDMTTTVTYKGLDHYRRELSTDQFQAVFVLAGDKGWRKFGDNSSTIEGDAVANEKRTIYLWVIPVTLVPLKTNGFKFEAAGEEKVGDKPAVILKVTGPDGKDFTLSFDKESGLPVKQVAKVVGFQGQEYTLESTFSDYKDFGGIKKATKLQLKRDGEKFQDLEVTEFKVLDKVDPDAFTEPK
jgi:hypothetical protein